MNGITELSWTAIGAIAQALQAMVVLASAIVIVYEVKRMRRESIEDRVTGLKLAADILDSGDFAKVKDAAFSGQSVRGVDWQSLFEQINLVALLVDEGYTELSLLLKLKGVQIAMLDQLFQNDAPQNIKSELTYKPAYEFFKKARQFVNNNNSNFTKRKS
jgi:hypothetical protein